ncbi:MAG: EVE domain-containing protein [Candidatus Edwardsbacteria bacterium]
MKKPYWIIVGPEESWKTAFSHQDIWGVKEALYAEWKALDPEDIIFFYVTAPIGGIIGIGRVATKFIQDRPLWPDEIASGKLIYPYRFEFHVDYLIEQKEWEIKKFLLNYLPERVEELIS